MNEIFQALSDPTRRQILRLLRKKDLTAGAIAAHFPLAKSTLSGHFRMLKHAGLIVCERRGVTLVYSLNASTFEEAIGAVLELLQHRAESKEASHESRLAVRTSAVGAATGDVRHGRR